MDSLWYGFHTLVIFVGKAHRRVYRKGCSSYCGQVPIHPESRKYLRFRFKGTIYEFSCLPSSLSQGPRVFTRIIRPIVAQLHSEAIRTVIYLNDLLLIHEIFRYVRRLLSSLGFTVKLEPTRCLVFPGAVLDTSFMSLALPGEQFNRIQGACQEMLESQSTSLGGLSILLGRMSHPAQLDCGWHHYITEPCNASRQCFSTSSVGDQGVRYHFII